MRVFYVQFRTLPLPDFGVVSRGQLVDSATDVHPELAIEHDGQLARPRSMWLRGVTGASGQSQLVCLDPGARAGGNQRPAFHAAVGGAQDLRLASTENRRALGIAAE